MTMAAHLRICLAIYKIVMWVQGVRAMVTMKVNSIR